MKNGIELVESNENMSSSYLMMAEESLKILKTTEESKLWASSISYYTIYYSLYSVMMKIGVKCEIHSCSIEFMKRFLSQFYDAEDIKLVKIAFDIRNDLQYYPDRLVNTNNLKFVKIGAVDFLIKTKNILSKITQRDIENIRKSLENEKTK